MLGKQPEEVRLRHQQLSLKDAIVERRNYPKSNRAVTLRNDDLVAQLAVKYVRYGVRIAYNRNCAIRLCATQQQPWVRSLRVAGS
jgi:hypothetical protein